MAGNSQRRGAMRKPGTKKGAVVGSGGQSRRGVKGRGPTPPAEVAQGPPGGPAGGGGGQAGQHGRTGAPGRPARGKAELPETVVGRNPVVEALRAGVPATALYVAAGWPPTSGSPRRSPGPASVASRCSRCPGRSSTG